MALNTYQQDAINHVGQLSVLLMDFYSRLLSISDQFDAGTITQADIDAVYGVGVLDLQTLVDAEYWMSANVIGNLDIPTQRKLNHVRRADRRGSGGADGYRHDARREQSHALQSAGTPALRRGATRSSSCDARLLKTKHPALTGCFRFQRGRDQPRPSSGGGGVGAGSGAGGSVLGRPSVTSSSTPAIFAATVMTFSARDSPARNVVWKLSGVDW